MIIPGVGITCWSIWNLYKNYKKQMYFIDNVLSQLSPLIISRVTTLTENDIEHISTLRQRSANHKRYKNIFQTWIKRVISVEVDDGASHIDVFLHFKSPIVTLRPLFFWCHGGGMVLGDARDPALKDFCDIGDVIIASVEYRLAPEHKFPTAPIDCLTALRYLLKNANEYGIDTNNVTVAGGSAGGNLAAVITQMAQKYNIDIHFQVLIVPMIRYGATTRSCITWGTDTFLTNSFIIWFWNMYVRTPADARDPRCCPLEGNLKNLPPALVVTATCDPLKDEGVEYKEALQRNGVDTTHIILKGSHIGGMWFDTEGMKKVKDEIRSRINGIK